MKKIKDLSEVNNLISAFMKKGILSNNYIMPEKYAAYIQEEALYFEKTESALVLFLDCNTYRRVFYYIKDCSTDIQLPPDKPLVMEIVCKTKNDSHKNALAYWVSKGFEPYIYRSRMFANPQALKTIQPDGQALTFASGPKASILQAMLADAFDPYLGCVPSVPEVESYIENKEIIVAQDESGQINGILHTGHKNSTYFIWHLLVNSNSRQKGVAKKLVAYFISNLPISNKTKIQLWVKNDNNAARGLYESLGFDYDGWESVGLIRRNNNYY